MKNRRIILSRYPRGVPQPEDFELVETDVTELNEDEVLVETHCLSMDPAPRLRMDGAAKFPPPLPLGEVVMGRGAGIVRASRFSGLTVGDRVAGELGWQEHARVPGAQLRKVNPNAPLQSALGVLGPSGITAYFLIHDAAKVRAGDTVVICGAAGSVGSVAAQLAREVGARVVGIVGGADQARFVREELGAAVAVNYRSAGLDADLASACPGGATVFLDSVGGSLHNSVLASIADHARIIAFGYISAYHNVATVQAEYGSVYQIIRRRATLSGFLIGDYANRFGEALEYLSAALSAGTLKSFEHCVEGLERAPAAFAALFSGEPIGKQLVRVRTQTSE